ncbi:peptide chain release factor N(5)-glutamine methyltransferase [Pelagibacteraceae bacterium]|nr:peptide chain release factor N(5)-glutamine methyltransferase [Pelagibacteraceae bacterium]
MTPNKLIKLGSNFLKKNNIKSFTIDSELFLSNASGQSRIKLLKNPDFKLNSRQINSFNKLILKRALSKKPVAYLLNKKEFWSINLNIDTDVLIPRPETEILVESLVKYFRGKNPYTLDIGTGSGCIIISLLQELKKSKGVAIDISRKALKIAKKNSEINNTFKRIRFVNSSISSFQSCKFDLIVSNPPYIARHELKNLDEGIKFFEPKIALDGGNDGLDVMRKVIYKSRKILKINGMLALEIGNGQYRKVSQILKLNRFREKFLVRDYKDNIRCIFSILNHY